MKTAASNWLAVLYLECVYDSARYTQSGYLCCVVKVGPLETHVCSWQTDSLQSCGCTLTAKIFGVMYVDRHCDIWLHWSKFWYLLLIHSCALEVSTWFKPSVCVYDQPIRMTFFTRRREEHVVIRSYWSCGVHCKSTEPKPVLPSTACIRFARCTVNVNQQSWVYINLHRCMQYTCICNIQIVAWQ